MHASFEPALQTEWRSLASLDASVDEWRELAMCAVEPNVFYEPAFALAAAAVFGPDAGAVLVRSAAGRIAGLFPARVEHGRSGIYPSMLVGFVHPYGPLGTPLVDRDQVGPVIDAWLDHLDRDPSLPRLVLMPMVPENGPLAEALDAALVRHGLRCVRFGRHRRALLAPGDERTRYVERAVRAKLRKELGRKRRRLAENGRVTHTIVDDAAKMPRLIAQFLAIEASGWKGRAGTAAAKYTDIHAFLEKAVVSLADEGKARGDVLSLGEEPLAIMIILRSAARAWAWKIAFDERFSHYSPGVQLTLDATKSLLRDENIGTIDSCATADHPMIDHLWRERLELSDRLIAVRPGLRWDFAWVCIIETARRGLIAIAKMVHRRFLRLIKRARATGGE